jgi:hypothetical protein
MTAVLRSCHSTVVVGAGPAGRPVRGRLRTDGNLQHRAAADARLAGLGGGLEPISSIAAATLDQVGTPVGSGDSWVGEHAPAMAGVGPVILRAIFLPLAVRRLQRLSR